MEDRWTQEADGCELVWTDKKDAMPNCEHFLLYLNARTWTSGEASAALASEVLSAMTSGVHLLLAHESEVPCLEELTPPASHSQSDSFARITGSGG